MKQCVGIRLYEAQMNYGASHFYKLILILSLALASCGQAGIDAGKSKDVEPDKNVALQIPAGTTREDYIFIQARVNNSEPLWFVLDSGSDTLVINSRLSESLGLKFDGKTIVGGAGEKTVEA